MDIYEDIDIKKLIIMCREHDEEAFSELVRRYTPMMRKVSLSFESSGFEQDELMAEACVALHFAAQRFDLSQDGVTFGLYAQICVHHRIVDLFRSRKDSYNILDVSAEDISDNGRIESDIVNRETVAMLMKSARALLSDYEYLVLMLHIQGYKTSQIAERLDRTAKSVDNAKSRLFRRLRGAIGDSLNI